MGFWAGILIGMVLGACVGFILAALCHAASIGEDEEEADE